MKKEFKNISDRLLELSLGIKELLGEQAPGSGNDVFAAFEAELEKMLSEKDMLIEKLQKLKNSSEPAKTEFAGLKENDFCEIWTKISELEAENLKAIQGLQRAISQELIGNKTHSRVISSYRFTKDVQPRLFDDSL